jgi:adenosylcobinamide-GDP ribazoletransferase
VNAVRELVGALRFLTIVPVGRPASTTFGAAAFPFVGALLGLVFLLVDSVPLPISLRNVAILATSGLATGAIHYDGLADTLDALGGATRDERLRIMRDGSIGVFAVFGLLIVVLLELAALAELSGRTRTVALLTAPALGRWAMVLTAFRAAPARPDGLGARFVGEVEGRRAAIATATAVVLAVGCAGAFGAFASLMVGLTAVAVRRFAHSRFGGVTGDVLGGAGLIGESLALVWFAAA